MLICLTAVFFLLAYSGIYSHLTDSNLWLQDLYAAVEQAGEAAEDYAFLGEEESRILYQKTRNEISENFDSLFSLKKENIYGEAVSGLKWRGTGRTDSEGKSGYCHCRYQYAGT